jgi:hypothetical protein
VAAGICGVAFRDLAGLLKKLKVGLPSSTELFFMYCYVVRECGGEPLEGGM